MTNRPTNAELFARAGRALYGEAWQQDTARLLGWREPGGRANRRVQYIAEAAEKGEAYRIPPGVIADLIAALEARSGECKALAQALRAGNPDATPKP